MLVYCFLVLLFWALFFLLACYSERKKTNQTNTFYYLNGHYTVPFSYFEINTMIKALNSRIYYIKDFSLLASSMFYLLCVWSHSCDHL